MPSLDVSDILLDPDFAEELVIRRREEVVTDKGRATTVSSTISPKPWGVVLPQNDAPMQRGPDQQNLPRLLQVHTPFRLRGPSRNPATGRDYQPDILLWQGDEFVVNKVHDFSKYGRGFVQADCSSMVSTEAPPE